MKKLSIVICAILLLVTGCAKNRNLEKDKIVAINATSYFQQRKDSEFYVLLDSYSKDNMTVDELSTEFDDLIKIYGEPLEYDTDEVVAYKQENAAVVSVPVRFTTGWMDLTYTINSTSSVTGFKITVSDKLDENGYNETQFVYKVDAREENAVFTNTNKTEQSPLVIFVHDKDMYDKNSTIGVRKLFRDLAYALADNGVASVRYNRMVLENEDVEDSIALMKAELKAVYEASLSLEGIDPNRVYVLGYGIGGYLLPNLVDDLPIQGMILSSAPYEKIHYSMYEEEIYEIDCDKTMLEQNKNVRKQEIENSKLLIDSLVNPEDFYQDIFGYSSSFWIELQTYTVAEKLNTFARPIMVTHGSNDYHVVSSSHNVWKHELADVQNVTYKYYKNMDHLLSINNKTSLPSDQLKEGSIASAYISDIVKFVQE